MVRKGFANKGHLEVYSLGYKDYFEVYRDDYESKKGKRLNWLEEMNQPMGTCPVVVFEAKDVELAIKILDENNNSYLPFWVKNSIEKVIKILEGGE